MPSLWRRPPACQPILGIRSYARARPGRPRVLQERVLQGEVPSRLERSPHDTPRRLLDTSNATTIQDARHAAPQQPQATQSQQKSEALLDSFHGPSSISSPALENVKAKPIFAIPPSILYEHWDLAAPSRADLQESRAFFTKNPAKLLFSAAKLLDVPFTSTPEIALVGRSNVGKSTLLNALLQTSLAKTSSKPGKTKTMNAYDLGGGKMTLLDMPGYGRGSREEWGVEITKYLQRRKELRRVFVLIDAVHQPGEGRIKREDMEMLAQLSEMHIPHQIVLGKIDRALFTRDTRPPYTTADLARSAERVQAVLADVKRSVWSAGGGEGKTEPGVKTDGLRPFGQLLAVTGDMGKWAKLSDEKSGALGVDALRWALLVATGLAKVLPSRVVQEKKKASGKGI